MSVDNNITVLSMNVRGLLNTKKRLDVFSWAKGKGASIVCLQETHCNEDMRKRWEDEWGNKCIFSHCSNKSAGVCIMFKQGLDFTVHDSKTDSNGRFIVLDCIFI